MEMSPLIFSPTISNQIWLLLIICVLGVEKGGILEANHYHLCSPGFTQQNIALPSGLQPTSTVQSIQTAFRLPTLQI